MITFVDEEARWATALARLADGATPTDDRRARRSRRRAWLLVTVLLLAAVAIGVAVGVLSGDEPEPVPDVARWREVAGLVLSIAGLLGVIVGGVVAWRAGLWRGLSQWPTVGLTRGQQRLLVRQAQGKVPADAERLPLARALARRLVLQGRLRPFFVGMGVQQLGQLVRSDGGWSVAFPVVSLLCLFAASVALTVQSRRAGRFLAVHPAPDDRA